MKIAGKTLTLLCAWLMSSAAAAALITGDVTGGGDYVGTVSTADGWIAANPTPYGNEVNFWTLSGNAGDQLSVSVSSYAIDFGISLYLGAVNVMDLLVDGFDNAGDFGGVQFVAGTSPFGILGNELLDVVLPSTGTYSLAVGGNGFGTSGDIFYQMNVAHGQASAVPEPGSLALMGVGLMAVAALRRRQRTV